MRTLLGWKQEIGIALLANWLNVGSLSAQDGTIEDAFRDGLYQEEVEDDLDAALSAYKDVSARVGRLRQLGAKALFREAAVLRKLERNEEAIARYQTLLLQYPEDETLAKISKEHLIALGVQLMNDSNSANIPTAEQEEIDRLKRIVANSPDLLNAGEGKNGPPLHLAAQKGQLHVAKFLVDEGANMDGQWHGTPLQHAAKAGHKAMCELLLEHGAKNEALLAAIEHSRNAVTLLLLDKGADPNAEEMVWRRNGKLYAAARPIHWATYGKSSTAVLELLLNAGAKPNERMSSPTEPYFITRTPLSQAIHGGFVDRVKLLLNAGANPNQSIREGQYDDHERTMLQMALACQVRESRPAMIDALLNAGAKWAGGDVQLTLGEASISLKRLKVALDAGLDPSTANGHHYYPAIHKAAAYGRTEALDMLLEHGAPIDFRNSNGETALHVLCGAKGARADTLDTIEWLINHGADVDALDNDGNSPLERTLATWRKHIGSDVARKHGSGEDIAWEKGALLLLKHGANPRVGQAFPSFDSNVPPDSELFEKFWHAYHLTNNPQRPKAIWLSRRIGAVGQQTSPAFVAILSKELLPNPGTLRRFLHTATWWTAQIHPEVTITRLKEDGNNETVQLDLTDKPHFELQWGDVVELPFQRSGAAEETEVYDWINTLKGMEVRVRVGEHHLLSNTNHGTYAFPDREMLTHGNALAFLGVSPYFVESHTIAQVREDGIIVSEPANVDHGKKADSNASHGNEVRIKIVESKPRLSEEALRKGVHVCESLDGPFWPVKYIHTWEKNEGIELGLMAPHGLPLHPIDWEKATVRLKNAEGWEEQRLLERESLVPWKHGTVFVLPKSEVLQAWSPHPILKKRIEDQFALTWQLGIHDEPFTTKRYLPPFFTAAKEGDLWVWKDATTPATRPLIPNPVDLYAVHPSYLPNRSMEYKRDADETRVLKIVEPAPPSTPGPSSKKPQRRVILPSALKAE